MHLRRAVDVRRGAAEGRLLHRQSRRHRHRLPPHPQPHTVENQFRQDEVDAEAGRDLPLLREFPIIIGHVDEVHAVKLVERRLRMGKVGGVDDVLENG